MSSLETGFFANLKKGLFCRCPKCGSGKIFKKNTLSFVDQCPSCGLKLAAHDSGDGPAVFLLFIFCFLIPPLAIWVDIAFKPSVWVHVLLWGGLCIGLTLLALRPAKAYVLALLYHHRRDLWK